MAAIMDLDLNCSPPSPEPADQADLNRSMLRHQVKDLGSPYWAHQNLTDVPPFWKQYDGMLRAHPPLHHSHMSAGDNLVVKGSSVQQQHGPFIAQGMRSGSHYMIDLEKPATLDDDDDDVAIVSFQRFVNYGTSNSQCVPPESSPIMGDLCRDHTTPYVNYGSSGSSDTPDSHSPVRTRTNVSGRLYFDLNVAQEDEINICPYSSEVLYPLLTGSATRNSGGCSNNSSNILHHESSIGSSKGSCVTFATAISAPDGRREATPAGLFCDSQSNMSFGVETSKYNSLLRGNKHQLQTLDKNSGLEFQGPLEIARISSVSANAGNNSSLGVSIPGDSRAANLNKQPSVAVRMESQEDSVTIISDSEMEIFDLNVPVESIDLPSKVAGNYGAGGVPVDSYGSEENSYFTCNEGQHNISLAECLTSKSEHMAENKASADVQSPPGFRVAIDRSALIPETPQCCDWSCPKLRSSSNGVSNQLETVCIHQAELGEDERSAARAAETLVSLFATSSAWMTDSHGSNSQTDPTDGNHKSLLSLDSFEEGVLNLEEMKDDGESVPVRPPDKDAQSCGIKLKRGRGLRDFQRDILPGLVSLARHEICDDLHAIGYEMSKTRSRRSSGEHGTPMRTRLPRRCSTAWNR